MIIIFIPLRYIFNKSFAVRNKTLNKISIVQYELKLPSQEFSIPLYSGRQRVGTHGIIISLN